MKLAFWRKSSPDDEKRVAEATTPSSNPLAKVLRRFTAPEPDWREIEEALLASDVGLVATTALIQAARDAEWAPVSFKGQLHDRASYRFFWQVLERAHQTGRALPQAVQTYFVEQACAS